MFLGMRELWDVLVIGVEREGLWPTATESGKRAAKTGLDATPPTEKILIPGVE